MQLCTKARPLWGAVLVFTAMLAWTTAGLFPLWVKTDLYTTLFWRSLFGAGSLLLLRLVLALRPASSSKSPIERLREGSAPHSIPPIRSLDWVCSRTEWGLVVVTSLSMITYVAAFYYNSIATVSLIYASCPMVTLVLGALFLRHKITALDIWCTAGVLLGVGVVVYDRLHHVGGLGLSLAMAMTVFFAWLTLAAAHYPKVDVLKITAYGALLTALVAWPLSRPFMADSWDIFLLFLYGFINIALGFFTYMVGSRMVSPITATLITLLEVLFAPLWAYLFFQQVVNTQTFIGGGIILTAVLAHIAWQTSRVESTEGAPR